MSDIKDMAREELKRRFDLYLGQVTDEQLIGENGSIPLWLAVCQMFDIVAQSNKSIEMVHQINEGNITKVYTKHENLSPAHPSSDYAGLIERMKGRLPPG